MTRGRNSRAAPAPDEHLLDPVAKVRVIYGDTDKMGVVYHGTYLRYLEFARVELIRSLGKPYSRMEAEGFGLPVIDLSVTYLSPARYDDLVSLRVGLQDVGFARVSFIYTLTVEPGDRHDLDERVTVLHAVTRHGCVKMSDGRATRLPEDIHRLFVERDALQATRAPSSSGDAST